jgi:hypothetical protein
LILFVVLKTRGVPTSSAFLAASFAHMILAILIYPLHIIIGVHFYSALILPPLALLVLWVTK